MMTRLRLSVALVVVVVLLGTSWADAAAQTTAAEVAALRQRAERGEALAQWNLGFSYSDGDGVPQNDVEAHKWYSLTELRATGDEKKRRAKARDLVAERMPPAQLADAQQRASEWHEARKGQLLQLMMGALSQKTRRGYLAQRLSSQEPT
jgi:TPR repeat protein